MLYENRLKYLSAEDIARLNYANTVGAATLFSIVAIGIEISPTLAQKIALLCALGFFILGSYQYLKQSIWNSTTNAKPETGSNPPSPKFNMK